MKDTEINLENKPADNPENDPEITEKPAKAHQGSKEYGGRAGPEPTRYGDWENNGIISDF